MARQIDTTNINTQQLQELLGKMEYEIQKNVKDQFRRFKNEPLNKLDKNQFKMKVLQNIQVLKNKQLQIRNKYALAIELAYKYEIAKGYEKGKQITDTNLSGSANTETQLNNSARLNELLNRTKNDIEKAVTDLINNSIQMFQSISLGVLQSPERTLFKAVDTLAATLMASGITAKRYANNTNVPLSTYGAMVSRETAHKSILTGEGDRRNDYGKHYVYITVHQSSCPLCRPYQGKILIDDVYADGKPDGKHTLLSTAISKGLFHFNCRHNALPYEYGKDKKPKLPKNVKQTNSGNVDNRQQAKDYKAEQTLRKYQNNIRKQKILQKTALTTTEKQRAAQSIKQYQAKIRAIEKDSSVQVYRQSWRENPDFKVSKIKPFITQQDIDTYNLGELGGRWFES